MPTKRLHAQIGEQQRCEDPDLGTGALEPEGAALALRGNHAVPKRRQGCIYQNDRG